MRIKVGQCMCIWLTSWRASSWHHTGHHRSSWSCHPRMHLLTHCDPRLLASRHSLIRRMTMDHRLPAMSYPSMSHSGWELCWDACHHGGPQISELGFLTALCGSRFRRPGARPRPTRDSDCSMASEGLWLLYQRRLCW